MADEDEPYFLVISSEEKLALWDNGIETWNSAVRGELLGSTDLIERSEVEIIVVGDAAMSLWRRGALGWNAWVEKNPNASLDFSEQHFAPSGKTMEGVQIIDFGGRRFPSGDVSFFQATFADGFVRFFHTDFAKAHVSFNYAKFGTGDISFFECEFDGDVEFFNCAFGSGDVEFRQVAFRNDVTLDNASVEDGDFKIEFCSFGTGLVSMRNIAFPGRVLFDYLRDVRGLKRFTLDGCRFEKLFTFSHDGKMGCPVDLRRTSIAHDVVVQDIHCSFELKARPRWKSILNAYWTGMPHGMEPHSPWLNRAKDPEDSQRFRKLKELAVANRNHAKALEFHAQEIRSQRGHGTTKLQDLAQFLYWIASDYGRSVKRPFGWLIALWFTFAGLYWQSRTAFSDFPAKAIGEVIGLTRDFGTVLGYSGSNMLAFIPTGGTARQQGIELLYGGQVPDWVLLMAGVQSILAVILLFLLGLGLRNMFRV